MAALCRTKQENDLTRGDFCEGTPGIQDNWWGNFVMTVLVYLAGLQATPLWSVSWFLGFYLWFSSTCPPSPPSSRNGEKSTLCT